ncbi:hypothetical protein ACOCEA_04240 [Maribacter sp. CXY002]|uniref:hypothetical protein n=1 Tax=Maribacter luteocoastalis TaxID=3407671 RepID=UPI003B67E222
MGKQNIDELFQKKFKDFKEIPDAKVWTAIETTLNKKRKKKVIPFWWQLGGIAAALIIGFIVMNPFNKTITSDDTITDTEQLEKKSEHEKADTIDRNVVKKNDPITNNSSILKNKDTQQINTEQNKTKNPQQVLVSNNTKQNIKSGNPNNFSKVEKNYKEQNSIVVNTNTDGHQNDILTERIPPNSVTDANTTANVDTSQTNKSFLTTVKDERTATASQKLETAITDNDQKSSDKNADANKKSIFEEIPEEGRELVVESNKGKRWSVGPSIAPVYFNAMGEGSPVHPSFVPNSKSGNVNLSYGLAIAYEISPKLTVKSGVHKVDYGYDTNDVSFSTSLASTNTGQIKTIDYNSTSKNLVVTSRDNSVSDFSVANKSIDFLAQNPEKYGVMSQQFGYIEVPLELNYAVIDNTFGLNIIGGVSSLFLVDNAVALTSGDLTTEMGEANNMNDLNFSANFGLGVNYKLSQKVKLNIEPVFKYQLNTFTQTQGTFNPYSIGVYSGLSFKF